MLPSGRRCLTAIACDAPSLQRFEDGTLPFIEILSLKHGAPPLGQPLHPWTGVFDRVWPAAYVPATLSTGASLAM